MKIMQQEFLNFFTIQIIQQIFGLKKTADDLEFETFEEALEKSTWLRRPNGGYSEARYINNGAELVNHGFQNYLLKQTAARNI